MILIADSGSTKTDWSIVDNCTQINSISTQGINPFHQSETVIKEIIEKELLPYTTGCLIDKVYFYGSGCRDEVKVSVSKAISTLLTGLNELEVEGDLLGAARSLCGTRKGVACILGTGANSCLYDGNRIIKNTPPLGYVLGDEGSGAVLGKMFINALYKDRLPSIVKTNFQEDSGLTIADVISKVYREPLPNRFLASLSKYIILYLDIPEVHNIVVSNFRNFFTKNIPQYNCQEMPINAIGSIAYYFKAQFEEAATLEGYKIGLIEQRPMEGLIRFHAE